jgi:hydroxymethylpyrimidine pyrophosphatase-like HAD family hydrolase
MRYLALACDYDGTLAAHGQLAEETLAAVERLLASGRKLILVTGRELEDLLHVFPQVNLCEWVVAENGAVLYRPATQEITLLESPPPAEFLHLLQARGVAPLSTGRVIVATRQPYENVVLDVIRDLGLELQVIFNKGAVMILPAGVNKATGLRAALQEMRLSAHNVVGVGDAENDHAFLGLCECAVAVAGALRTVKERADVVLPSDNGVGVVELIDELVENDFRMHEPQLTRHHILLGTREGGEEVQLSPSGVNLLLAGTSGSGKSTLATGFLERLAERGYQLCIIDPEGDYENMEAAVVVGDNTRPPSIAEVLRLLENPAHNVVVNLLGLPLEDRPTFFVSLLSRLQELRMQTGRPHWMVLDEAHHLLPASWNPVRQVLTQDLTGMLLITVHPDQVAPAVLTMMHLVIAIGESPAATLRSFSAVLGQHPPALAPRSLKPGEALLWARQPEQGVQQFRIMPSRTDRIRHRRKYAQGELGEDKSFYFRGPQGQLNLRAQNLMLFMQLAEGVDDATWTYHLWRGDYSRWFREAIKDEDLAASAADIEQQAALSPPESRQLIKTAIQQRYTLPAASPTPLLDRDHTPSA